MTSDGLKWKMGIPELIIIVTLIIALATTLNMKASSNDLIALNGRVTVLEGQFATIMSNQAKIETMLNQIDDRQRRIIECVARLEETKKKQ